MRYIFTSEYSAHLIVNHCGAWKYSRERAGYCSSKFPTEVYETLIDCVAEVSNFESRNDLARCARVCRAWVPRAQMHLFSAIIPRSHKGWPLKGFQDAIHRKPFLLQYIRTFKADCNIMGPQPMTLLTLYHMPSLKKCYISWLDLDRGHPSLSRFPSNITSLQLLVLGNCETVDTNRLFRFLTSFRSLSKLCLAWAGISTSNDHNFPHLRFNRSKCSLDALAIQWVPGKLALLESFVKAPPFVTHMKRLVIAWSPMYIPFSPLHEFTELLHHCSQSLEEVIVIVGDFVITPDVSSCAYIVNPHSRY